MKDLTISMPKWYNEKRKEYVKTLNNALHSKYLKILIYSNVVKKVVVVVNTYDNGWDDELYGTFYGIYDFEKNVFYKISDGMPIYRISGVNYWDTEQCGSFAWFELNTGHVISYGEYDETYKLVIDSKMNNAPNLSGKDVFDNSFRTVCDIVNDFLYFEYKGTRYLIDGDYRILAKFPKKLDVCKNAYVDASTKQFILKDGSK